MIACERGHLNIVQLLVEKQANISLKTKVNVIVADALHVVLSIFYVLHVQKGHTCLMAACQNGHLDIVEFLLAHPQVDVNARSEVISFDSS